MSYRRVSPQLAYGAAHGTNFVLAAAGVRYSATLLVFPKVEEVTPSSPRAANEAKWKEEILPNSTTLAQILYFPAPPRFVRIDIRGGIDIVYEHSVFIDLPGISLDDTSDQSSTTTLGVDFGLFFPCQ
jgi:hypothetical protein